MGISRRAAAVCIAILLAGIWTQAAMAAGSGEMGNASFQRQWERTDRPVASSAAARTWAWGPEALSPVIEEYDPVAPDGVRRVQYFDKGRMQFTPYPDVPPGDDRYVESGLIVRELVSGRFQTGPDSYEEPGPATFSVSGDVGDAAAPTYASFAMLLDAAANPDGATLIQRIERDGSVSTDEGLGGFGVTAAYHVDVPGLDHQIASPFWEFMTSGGMIYEYGGFMEGTLFADPFFVLGFPITEAYWTRVLVAGQPADVLVQLFERRVLTYNPAKPTEWRVQFANAGAHYAQWRYGGSFDGATIVEPGWEPHPSPGPDLGGLESQLRPLVESWAGENAVTVTDLQTGQQISINGDRPQLAACTNKIFIMVAVAQDIAAGKYTAADVEHLVIPAMGPSLTPQAKELIRIIGDGDIGAGLRRMNAIMQELGMVNSIITHPPSYFGEEYGYAVSHGIVENRLTTNDLNQALGRLWRGELLPEETRDYFWWSLTIATDFLDGSMGGPLGPEARMYHKIGVLYEPNNTWNDAGIIVFERGGQEYAYAISYLSSFSPDNYRTGYWQGYTVSELTWQAFNNAP